ncbi:MAG: hypothetical protein ACYC26_04445 [Phycisphaerales bacterium]
MSNPTRTANAGADWSMGLAGLLEQRLAESGVRLMERQAIRCLSRESRLDQALGDEAIHDLRKRLPGVDLIVTGEISRRANQQFELSLRLVRATDGQLLRVFKQTGGYPQGLENAVDRAAADVAATLPENVRSLAPPKPRGFTDNPELALWFHRGLEHFGAKDYIWAAAYFDAAAAVDDDFDLARIWSARALDKAGFGYMADGVRKEMDRRRKAAATGKQEIDKHDADTTDDATARWRLMVVIGSGVKEANAIIESLSHRKDIQLVQSATLRQAIREHDVQLDPMMEKLTASNAHWLSANGVLVVSRENNTTELRVMGIDDSRVIASRALGEDTDAVTELLKQLDQAGAAREAERKSAESKDELPVPTWLADGKSIPQERTDIWGNDAAISFAGAPIQLRAAALSALRQEPGNLNRLVETMEFTRPIRIAMLDQALALIRTHPDIEHADWWLSEMGYLRMEANFHGYRDLSSQQWLAAEPSIAEQNADLFQLFPDSDAAVLARYGMARQAYDQGHYQQAMELMKSLADRLPTMTIPYMDSDSIRLNVFYELGRAAYACGNYELAASAADECGQRNGDSSSYTPSYGYLYLVRIRNGQWVLGRQFKNSHASQYDQCTNERGHICCEVKEFIKAVERWRDTGKREGDRFMSDFDWFVQAMNSTGEKSKEANFRSLELRLNCGETKRTRLVDGRVVKQLAMLRTMIRTRDERTRFENVATGFSAGKSGEYFETYRLQVRLLLGEVDDARNEAEKRMNSVYASWFHDQLESAIHCNSLQYTRAEQVRRLLGYQELWEKRFGEPGKATDAERCVINEMIGTALLLLGEGAKGEACYQRILAMSDLPAMYRMHAEYQLARCRAKQGNVIEATRGLTDLIGRLETMPPTQFAVPDNKHDLQQWRRLGVLATMEPGKLLADARDVLERVRLIGGYHDLGGDTAYDVDQGLDGQTAALVFADSLLADKNGDEWAGKYKWTDHAANAMLTGDHEQQARVMRQLPLVLIPDRSHTFENDRGWEGLGGLADMKEGREINMRELEYLLHNGSLCDYHRCGGRLMRLTPDRSRWGIPSLVLNMGKSCPVCREQFTYTLGMLDDAPPILSESLMRMLTHDHPNVRHEAAAQLSRLYERPLPLNERGEVDDRSVRMMARYWAVMPDRITDDHAAVSQEQWQSYQQTPGRAFGGPRQRIDLATYSPDSQLLAMGDRTGLLIIRQTTTRNILAEVQAHRGYFESTEWSADSHELATSGTDLYVRIWRLENDHPLKLLCQIPQEQIVKSIQYDSMSAGWWIFQSGVARLFSSDGRLLKQWPMPVAITRSVAIAGRREIVLKDAGHWLLAMNMDTGVCREIAETSDWPWRFRGLNDGQLIIMAGQDLRKVPMDQTTPQRLVRQTGLTAAMPNNCYTMDVSPDQQVIVAADKGGTVRAFDLKTFTVKWEFRLPDAARPLSCHFMPDGRSLRLIDVDGRIFILDPATGRKLDQINEAVQFHGMTHLTLLHNSQWVVTAGAGSDVFARDIQTGKTLQHRVGHAGMVEDMVNVDGRCVVTIDAHGVLRVLTPDNTDNGPVRSYQTPQTGRAMLASWPGATRIAVVHSPTDGQAASIELFDSVGWSAQAMRKLPCTSVSAVVAVPTSSNQTLMIGTWKGELWRADIDASGTIKTELVRRFSSPVTTIAVSPLQRIAVGLNDGGIFVSNAGGFANFSPPAGRGVHKDRIHSLAFSPDGRRMVSGSRDRTLRVWDVSPDVRDDSRMIGWWRSPRLGVTAALFTSTHSLIAGTFDGGLYELNLASDLSFSREPRP